MKCGMVPAIGLLLAALSGSAQAQAPFPVGLDGELYLAPRIDLVPAGEGGPYTVTLDGVLDEPLWERAAFHTVNTNLLNAGEIPIDLDPPENDWQMIFAAAADGEYLYLAWKILDDPEPNAPLVTGEHPQCDVWQDDSIEIYLDAQNDGPNCTSGSASCYMADDAQITIGADQIGKDVPEDLLFGGVAGKGSCDFAGPAPEVALGIVTELQHGDLSSGFGEGRTGWQAEVAIALTTNGNADDGTPAWGIDPTPGTCIGFAMQGNDDDRVDTDGDSDVDIDDAAGGGRDHKLTWAKREASISESAWRNPGVFGKLSFYDPTKPVTIGACALPVDRLTCKRNPDGTVNVSWLNPGTKNPDVPTSISVDGVEKATVPGDASTVTLSEADVPQDGADKVISVKNNSDEAAPTCIIVQSPFDSCGGLRIWNMLGAYTQENGAAPTIEQIRLDYLTDGTTTELDFDWQPGKQIETDFGGASPSLRILKGVLTSPAKHPNGIPTVFEWRNIEGAIDFNNVFRTNINQAMVYAQTYVMNDTGGELDVYLGVSSDDSVQVLLNGEEVWINSIGRGSQDACAPQDISPDGVNFTDTHVLLPGANSLIVKVFEGEGDWKFALRFQNDLGEAITEGLSLSLTPPPPPPEVCDNARDDDRDGQTDCDDTDCAAAAVCLGARFHRGDADDNGELQLTDAIRILGFLFLGGAAPPCVDAGDADDNGKLELTDAIRILGFLFLGGPAPPSPGPPNEPCGQDPTPADAGGDLGCASYTRC